MGYIFHFVQLEVHDGQIDLLQDVREYQEVFQKREVHEDLERCMVQDEF